MRTKLPALLLFGVVFTAALTYASPLWAAPWTSCPTEGLTYRIVGCFNLILSEAMTNIYQSLDDIVNPIASATAILAVVVFGLRMSSGGMSFDSRGGASIPQGASEGVMLTLKIGLMMFFITSFDEYYPLTFDISSGLIEIVTTPLDSTMIDFQCTSKYNPPIDTSDPDYKLKVIWARVDCLVGAMMGFGVVGGGAFLGLAPVLEGALTSSLNDKLTGSIGPLIVYMGYSMMFGVIMAMFRALYVYVYSMIGLAFLWMLAPFAGMCLLFKTTTEYFTKWVTFMISLLLQPAIMLCFLTLMIVSMDRAMYTSPYSLLSILTGKTACDGATGACDYEKWKEYLTEMQTTGKIGSCTVDLFSVNRESIMMDKCQTQQQNRMATTQGAEPNQAQFVIDMVDPACSKNMPASTVSTFTAGFDGFTNFSVDSKCLNGVDSIELFASLAVIAVLAYLLYQTMEYIPEFASRITGGGNVPNITAQANASMPFQYQVQKGVEESANNYIANKDPGQAVEGFFRGGLGSIPFIGNTVRDQFNTPQSSSSQQRDLPGRRR